MQASVCRLILTKNGSEGRLRSIQHLLDYIVIMLDFPIKLLKNNKNKGAVVDNKSYLGWQYGTKTL